MKGSNRVLAKVKDSSDVCDEGNSQFEQKNSARHNNFYTNKERKFQFYFIYQLVIMLFLFLMQLRLRSLNRNHTHKRHSKEQEAHTQQQGPKVENRPNRNHP